MRRSRRTLKGVSTNSVEDVTTKIVDTLHLKADEFIKKLCQTLAKSINGGSTGSISRSQFNSHVKSIIENIKPVKLREHILASLETYTQQLWDAYISTVAPSLNRLPLYGAAAFDNSLLLLSDDHAKNLSLFSSLLLSSKVPPHVLQQYWQYELQHSLNDSQLVFRLTRSLSHPIPLSTLLLCMKQSVESLQSLPSFLTIPPTLYSSLVNLFASHWLRRVDADLPSSYTYLHYLSFLLVGEFMILTATSDIHTFAARVSTTTRTVHNNNSSRVSPSLEGELMLLLQTSRLLLDLPTRPPSVDENFYKLKLNQFNSYINIILPTVLSMIHVYNRTYSSIELLYFALLSVTIQHTTSQHFNSVLQSLSSHTTLIVYHPVPRALESWGKSIGVITIGHLFQVSDAAIRLQILHMIGVNDINPFLQADESEKRTNNKTLESAEKEEEMVEDEMEDNEIEMSNVDVPLFYVDKSSSADPIDSELSSLIAEMPIEKKRQRKQKKKKQTESEETIEEETKKNDVTDHSVSRSTSDPEELDDGIEEAGDDIDEQEDKDDESIMDEEEVMKEILADMEEERTKKESKESRTEEKRPDTRGKPRKAAVSTVEPEIPSKKRKGKSILSRSEENPIVPVVISPLHTRSGARG